MRSVGEAHLRRVLQRHPGTGVDLLRLAEHEGQLAAPGHRRRHPLQARGVGRSGVGHADVLVALWRLDGELAAEQLVRLEEHTSELQSLMRHSYAVLWLK